MKKSFSIWITLTAEENVVNSSFHPHISGQLPYSHHKCGKVLGTKAESADKHGAHLG
jgi:hypothetical protein